MISASIIIPTYNEINGLSTILNKVEGVLKDNPNLDIEFIFVDDGSDIPIKDKLIHYEKIKLIRNEKNFGYGYSIKKASKYAKNDIIGIIDSDNSYDLNFLIDQIKLYNDHKVDLIVGRRLFSYDEGILRKLYRVFLNKVASILCNYKILDINSGIRLFRKDFFLENIKYYPDKFSITSTQTLSYILQKKEIKYINTNYYKRSGKSKINVLKDPFNFIFLILKVYMLFSPLSFFTWTGLLFILFSIGLGIFTYFAFSNIADISVLLLFLTGVNCILFGLIAETIRLKNK